MTTATEALTVAASALHNAHNALMIARAWATLMQEHECIIPVQDHISEALDAIAAVIGKKAMLEA